MPFAPIPQVLTALQAGQMIVLVDDESRENEGDLVCALQFITPEQVNFMLREARGVLCAALSAEQCDRLDLAPQTPQNTAPLATAFTVSVDGHPKHGITTGVSAKERAITLKLLIDESSRPGDLARPGHIFPLRAKPGGVLERAGQTEGSVDLCRLAGLRPGAAIIEMVRAAVEQSAGERARGAALRFQNVVWLRPLTVCTAGLELVVDEEADVRVFESLAETDVDFDRTDDVFANFGG